MPKNAGTLPRKLKSQTRINRPDRKRMALRAIGSLAANQNSYHLATRRRWPRSSVSGVTIFKALFGMVLPKAAHHAVEIADDLPGDQAFRPDCLLRGANQLRRGCAMLAAE